MEAFETLSPVYRSPTRPPADLSAYDVTDDVAGLKTVLVNVFFIGEPGFGNPWVLVDTGIPGQTPAIRRRAEELFGIGCRPNAIVLTHGHFDHTGSLETLLAEWDVPVYAHRLEIPYLQGKSHYPPPGPAIGGGLMSLMSWLFPTKPLHLGNRVRVIADNGQIDELPGWRAIHTPGHAPGHISLFRDSDRVLIAGDAFVTTNQNALSGVISQREEFHGPPAYFTCDWEAARQSVSQLAALNPTAAGTGHGVSVRGLDLRLGLQRLSNQFEEMSIPSSSGRYVRQAAITDGNGIVSMPAPTSFVVARAIGVAVVAGLIIWALWPKRR